MRNEVEGPASAAKKLSAFFVSAPAYHQANYPTVVSRWKYAAWEAARFSRTTRAYLQNGPYPRSMRSKGYIGNTKPRTLTEHNVAGEIKRHGICDFPIDKIAALAGVCRTTVQTTMHESARLGHIRITPRPRPGRKSLTNIVEIISTEWKTWIKRGPSPARQIGSNPAKIASPTKNIDFKTKGAFRRKELSGKKGAASLPDAVRI